MITLDDFQFQQCVVSIVKLNMSECDSKPYRVRLSGGELDGAELCFADGEEAYRFYVSLARTDQTTASETFLAETFEVVV